MLQRNNAIEVDAACDRLMELGVRRSQFIKARIRVLNAAGALVRRALGWSADLSEAEQAKLIKAADKIVKADSPSELTGHLAEVAETLKAEIAVSKMMALPGEQHQATIEKEMRQLARELPAWEWAKDVKGLSDLGLAVIVAQAGNLSRYSTYHKLKKRLGLAPITKDGVTRAASTWRKKGGLTADEWQDDGPNGPKYSPRRRAQMFAQVGTMIIGGMGQGVRPYVDEDVSERDDLSYYQKEFVRQLRREVAKDPKMGRPPTAEGKESFSLHAKFKALRVVEQRLLKHLWQAWRRANGLLSERTIVRVPVSEYPVAAKAAERREAITEVPEKATEGLPPDVQAMIAKLVAEAMAK